MPTTDFLRYFVFDLKSWTCPGEIETECENTLASLSWQTEFENLVTVHTHVGVYF